MESLRSPLLVTAELTPMWLDAVPPVEQGIGMVGGRPPLPSPPVALRLRCPPSPSASVSSPPHPTFFSREGGGEEVPFRFARGRFHEVEGVDRNPVSFTGFGLDLYGV